MNGRHKQRVLIRHNTAGSTSEGGWTMARVTYNLSKLQDLYRKHFGCTPAAFNNSEGERINNNAYANINQLRRNVIRTNNSRKLSYCVPYDGTLNRHS